MFITAPSLALRDVSSCTAAPGSPLLAVEARSRDAVDLWILHPTPKGPCAYMAYTWGSHIVALGPKYIIYIYTYILYIYTIYYIYIYIYILIMLYGYMDP